MKKNVYSSDVKWAVVKAKLADNLTDKEIMAKYGIKNVSQIKTWVSWYRNNELYRFDQPIGKQYTYGHGPEYRTDDERKNIVIESLEMENEILKKYIELRGELKKKSF